MQDNSSELSVLVDRSVGGSSLVDGQIELMLHRFSVPIYKLTLFAFVLFNVFLLTNQVCSC